MKTCTKCLTERELEMFPLHKAYKGGRTTWCRVCLAIRARVHALKNKDAINARNRETYRNNPDVRRNLKLKLRYGITLEQYNSMLLKQNYRCLICDRLSSESTKKRLVVDHCHITGKIRGLICDRCNVGIGSLGDNIEILINAVDYLLKSI